MTAGSHLSAFHHRSNCQWQLAHPLHGLQALPKDGQPLAAFQAKGLLDDGLNEVALGISKVVVEMRRAEAGT